MRGLMLFQNGGTLPLDGWRECPAVLFRWGLLFVRTAFDFDAVLGPSGSEHLAFYEQRRGNPLRWPDSEVKEHA